MAAEEDLAVTVPLDQVMWLSIGQHISSIHNYLVIFTGCKSIFSLSHLDQQMHAELNYRVLKL